MIKKLYEWYKRRRNPNWFDEMVNLHTPTHASKIKDMTKEEAADALDFIKELESQGNVPTTLQERMNIEHTAELVDEHGLQEKA
jgi:hypothetical protein